MTYFDEAATDINRFQERRAESEKWDQSNKSPSSESSTERLSLFARKIVNISYGRESSSFITRRLHTFCKQHRYHPHMIIYDHHPHNPLSATIFILTLMIIMIKRNQKTEEEKQKTETRKLKTESRKYEHPYDSNDQKAVTLPLKTEHGNQKTENENQKTENGNQKPENGK